MFGHQDNDNNNNGQAFDPGQDQTNSQQPAADTSSQSLVAPRAGDYHAPMTPSSPQTTPLLTAVAEDERTDTNATTPPADLVSLKVQALGELYPLVHKLELSPEENFRTIMMMIQATDNKDLIPSAYEAANKIEDENVKARALLDVVNEINYFTNQPTSN